MLVTNYYQGNCKTTLIINCAPELRHFPETLSTLRFGERAKNIENKVKINEELGITELTRLLSAARAEIEELKNRKLPNQESSETDLSLLDDDDNTHSNNDTDNILVNNFRGKISELEEEVEILRSTANNYLNDIKLIEAENTALKHSVTSLEDLLLQANLEKIEGLKKKSEEIITQTSLKAEDQVSDDGNDSGFDNDLKDDTALEELALENDIEEIEQESRGLPYEVLELESNSLIDKIETAKNASEEGKFVSDYAKLKNDYDTHVRRLLAKLAAEQIERAKVEDELENINVSLTFTYSIKNLPSNNIKMYDILVNF